MIALSLPLGSEELLPRLPLLSSVVIIVIIIIMITRRRATTAAGKAPVVMVTVVAVVVSLRRPSFRLGVLATTGTDVSSPRRSDGGVNWLAALPPTLSDPSPSHMVRGFLRLLVLSLYAARGARGPGARGGSVLELIPLVRHGRSW